MTKNQYLEELKKELEANKVKDIDEIISEYEDHFNYKLEEGLTEEEISRKLSSPKEIAKEFCDDNDKAVKSSKGLKTFGVVCMSIPLTMAYLIICCSVIVLGAFSLVSLVAGVCLLIGVNIANLIPTMPYVSSLFIGLASIGLSALSFVGTFYLFVYLRQWAKVYLRWCKNIINQYHYPLLSMHPSVSKKLVFKLKLVAIIGLVCLVSAGLVGYISMCISANSMEPWHIWNWFKK